MKRILPVAVSVITAAIRLTYLALLLTAVGRRLWKAMTR